MAVANARLPPPLLLGAAGTNCSKQWKDWLQQFEWYTLVAELDKKAANVQVAIFMSAIGQDAINVFNTFPEDKRVDLKLLITEFNNYFTPKVNITYERFVFNQVIQVAGQKFDDFYTEVLSKSQSCDFNTLRDSLVMDRIVIGVLHDSDRAHLLSVNELTLDKAVQFCRAAEQARVQLTSLKSDPVQVDVAKQVSTLDSTGNIGAAGDFVVHEMSKGGSPELSWFEDLLFDNCCVVRAKLDTGAQCNVLSLHHAKQAGLKVRPSTVRNIITYSNSSLKVAGECSGQVHVKNESYVLKFLVVNGDFQTIISKDACVTLKLIKRIESLGLADNLMKQEDGLGCIKNFIYDIDLVENPALEIFPARRVPHSPRDNVKTELDRMQELGIIVPVREPTPAVSPMVVVCQKVETSSPYHKRSNGLAERYVQEAKLLLMKCATDKSDMYLALLNQRNTPNGNLGSPVQRLMGRRTRGTLLIHEKLLKPQLIQNVSRKLHKKRNKYKEHHDRGTKLQQPLSVGQEVLLRVKRRKWKPAVIVSPGPTSRSYMVKMSDGRVFRRNSWFLRALHSQDATQSSSTQTTTSVAPTNDKAFRVSHRVLLTNLFPAFRLPVQGMKLVLRQDLEGQ
ncbi:hypothetical protein JTE90_019949 [Oedothorax gibbosus]|uniref:Peptidase A2 domain-containing protein n=1 Tax=Oedothorax gibbosus TaxID=931172 RepID=A0AAV6UTP7_9ARAC|nr:hypothetical protein JTE90_019949 [Oedothorax gibbosus]